MRLALDRPPVTEAGGVELQGCQLPEALFRGDCVLREHCTEGADGWAKTKNIARRIPGEQDASVLGPEEGQVASGVARRMDRLDSTCRRHFVAVVRLLESVDWLELRRHARQQRSEDLARDNVPIRPRRRLLAADDSRIQRMNVCLRASRAHEFGE